MRKSVAHAHAAWLKKTANKHFQREDFTMTETKTDLDVTIKTQLASLLLENGNLKKTAEALTEDNKRLSKQCMQLATVIENELKSDLMIKIMAKGDYKQSDLEPLTIEQLQAIDATLTKAKGAIATYKPIRTGNDSTESRMTVGSLYGKTREQILAMRGET